MTPMTSFGRVLVVTGLVLVVVGAVVVFAGRLPRVPGDVIVQRPNLTIYFPLGTMILISIVLTLILNFVLRR